MMKFVIRHDYSNTSLWSPNKFSTYYVFTPEEDPNDYLPKLYEEIDLRDDREKWGLERESGVKFCEGTRVFIVYDRYHRPEWNSSIFSLSREINIFDMDYTSDMLLPEER